MSALRPEPAPTIDDELIRQRARQLFGERQHSKVSSFLRHPLTALVLGFLLTGGLGVLIQYELDKSRKAAEQRESRRIAALSVVDSVGLRLNRLFYDAGRYYDALREHPADTAHILVLARQQKFDSTRALFEAYEYVDAARVCNSFGDGAQRAFRTIADSMHFIMPRLRRFGRGEMPVDTAARHIDNLRSLVASFALSMVRGAAISGAGEPPKCTGVSAGPAVSKERPKPNPSARPRPRP